MSEKSIKCVKESILMSAFLAIKDILDKRAYLTWTN